MSRCPTPASRQSPHTAGSGAWLRVVPISLAMLPTLLLALAAAPALAQRDPTLPPVTARPAAPAGVAASAPAPAPRQLIVVDGRRYVVDGGRRRGPGDALGDGRIERIDDAAVVVRGPTGLQRLPLYPGVIKRPAAEPPRPTDPQNRSKP